MLQSSGLSRLRPKHRILTVKNVRRIITPKKMFTKTVKLNSNERVASNSDGLPLSTMRITPIH